MSNNLTELGGVYPMRVVSRLTGLSADAIRVWERRYQAVQPERTDGNKRRYSDRLDLAEHYYESGDEGMRFLPLRARWAILVASRLYRGIGRRLRRRQQSNPMLGRVVVPWFEKLALVSKATATWLSLTDRSSRTRRTHQLRDYLDGLPYAGPDSNLDAPHERLPGHPLDRKKNMSPAAVSPIRPSANG